MELFTRMLLIIFAVTIVNKGTMIPLLRQKETHVTALQTSGDWAPDTTIREEIAKIRPLKLSISFTKQAMMNRMTRTGGFLIPE